MKNTSKIILFILICCFLLPILPAQAAGNAVIKLTSAKTSYYVGDTVYVDINVETNGESLNTVRTVLDFTGAEVLQINDFNLATAWPNQSPGKELNNTTDHINVGGFILVESVSQNSLFGTLIFKANAIGSSTITINSLSHLISPDQLEKINLAGSQGITINVIGPQPPPPPPPPPPAQNQAPVFAPIGNKAITLGQPVNFFISATDPENEDVTLTWNVPADANVSNYFFGKTATADFSWTPTMAGVYTLNFTATDSNATPKSSTLNVSVGVSVPVPPQNHAPIFEIVTEKTINAGQTLNFNVSATDPDGDNVTLTLEPLETATLNVIASGITTTSGFSWQPKTYGIYYAVFKAQDNNQTNPLSANLTVRITIFGGQCPPCSSGGGGQSCPLCQCQKQEFGQNLPKNAPIISSPTHPSQELWSVNNQPKFVWDVVDAGEGFIFNLDQNPLADPSLGYFFSKDKMFSYSQLADGFWYFHLKVKYADGFGPTAHYQIKIDTQAPEFFKPSIEKEVLADKFLQYKIYFSALDKHSGVAYFESKLDDQPWQKISSPYTLSTTDLQSKLMLLRVVDNAGNAIESGIDIPKMEVIKDKEDNKYTINLPASEYVLASPQITAVNLPLVQGTSLPGAKIYLFLSQDDLQIIFYTLSDYQGNWLAYLDKSLSVGKYALSAIANYNNVDSLPSETVYFSIAEKFSPKQNEVLKQKEVLLDYVWLEVLLILVAVSILGYILQRFVRVANQARLKRKLKNKKFKK